MRAERGWLDLVRLVFDHFSLESFCLQSSILVGYLAPPVIPDALYIMASRGSGTIISLDQVT